METLIGNANEFTVTFCGADTNTRIDSGSQVTTISKDFFNALSPTSIVVPLSLKLNLEGPDGKN